MLFFILTPLFLLIGLPLATLWLGGYVAMWARKAAESQHDSSAHYPVAQILEANFDPEPDSGRVWPPSPTDEPPVRL